MGYVIAFVLAALALVACGLDRKEKLPAPATAPECQCACTDCECAEGADCFCQHCACKQAPPSGDDGHDPGSGGNDGGCTGGSCPAP